MTRTFGQMVAEATAAVPSITAPEAYQRQQEDPDLLIVDVRDSTEASGEGTIPGAIHVPYGNLIVAADTEVPEAWRDPRLQDRTRPIITHCALGPDSAIAAKTLQDMGFTNVHYIEGGIEAWKASDLPTDQATSG